MPFRSRTIPVGLLGPLANLAGVAAAPPADYPGGAVASDGRSSVTADAGAVPGAAGVPADARPGAWSCSGESSTLSAKWQATPCPDAITRNPGSIVTHSSGVPNFYRRQHREW